MNNAALQDMFQQGFAFNHDGFRAYSAKMRRQPKPLSNRQKRMNRPGKADGFLKGMNLIQGVLARNIHAKK